MKKTKKILSMLLALVLVLGAMPTGVFAKTLDCEVEVHKHADECYKLVCESVEHKHNACNLSCDIEAHAHCHPTTCEIEAHKHNACNLSCDKEAHAHCYSLVCEKAEHAHDDDACYKRDAAELVTNIGDIEFVVGEPTEFTFSTVANDDAGVMVVGASDFSDPDAIEKLEYYEPNTDAWYDLNGEFGGSNGFPMADATSKFRVTFAEAGEFTFTSVMKKADTDEVLCSVEATAVVVEASAEEPEQPEEPATPDIDPDARCGKYEHKHNACNLSCKLYAHTHCHGDTCEIEEHEHKACTLACDKEVHIHCYPATEVDDEEPETPDEPETPEEPATPDVDPDASCGKYEHKHNACDLSCKLYAHTHCYGDTCEIEEHKHNACDLSCDKEAHTHCYPATETPDEPDVPETPEDPEEPVIPELPKPEEVEGYELNCETPAHKHTACDLSCPYDAHEHCFSDTCEIEAHKHTACTLACEKAEHTHCYTKIETEDPETPDEPEVPGDDEEDIIYISKLEVEVTAPAVGEAPVFDIESLNMDVDADLGDVYVDWLFNDVADLEDLDWDYMYDDDVFEAGKYYAATVEIYMPEGVEMAEDFEATLNGVDFDYAIFMEADEEYDASFYGVFVFDDLIDAEEPEDPEEPETPDTPVVPNVEGYQTKCAKEEHKHTACDLACDKEAHTHCFSDKCEKDHEHCYVKIEEEPEAPEYSIITGANGTWKDSSADGMIFASDAEFADFVSVKVDGAAIDATNYDAKEGSTVITLKNAYLKTLKEGEHTLTIVSKDGEASTKFTIEHEHKLTKVEAKKETCVDKGNSEYYTCECGKWFKDDKAETEIVDKTSVEIKAAGHKAATEYSRDAKSHWHKCTVCGEAADEKVAHNFDKETGKICQTCKYDVDNPKTGSEAHISAMAIIMTMSVVVMAGVAAYFVWDKKRKN